jgi:hypothetical protein
MTMVFFSNDGRAQTENTGLRRNEEDYRTRNLAFLTLRKMVLV